MSRKINAIPLTPSALIEEGAVPGIPPVPSGYSPDNSWEHHFRIIGSRGYQTEHRTTGDLKLKKQVSGSDVISLKVVERIIGERGPFQTLSLDSTCQNDLWATPKNWSLKCRFKNNQHQHEPDLDLDQDGEFVQGEVLIRQNGNLLRRRPSSSWTSRFSLIDAIQRRSPIRNDSDFDFLEDQFMFKPNHVLREASPVSADIPDLGTIRMRHIMHLGHGILPYDYYLDEAGRLLFAISMNRSYVLADSQELNTEITALQELEKQR